LAGLADDTAADAVLVAAPRRSCAASLPCPYGDGTTGPQVAAILADPATDALLAIEEPDFTDGSLPW
ncbi:MAG: UDP-N-acetylglucosamine 2-epimerase (non-hydrolyzing), partial [Blastococcus sp.]|nr:UDP-N-acetylglucosamine 2-epimerase (non-hydrolyzing) [Blastococcus sp.]